jgi:hypothetical protein
MLLEGASESNGTRPKLSLGIPEDDDPAYPASLFGCVTADPGRANSVAPAVSIGAVPSFARALQPASDRYSKRAIAIPKWRAHDLLTPSCRERCVPGLHEDSSVSVGDAAIQIVKAERKTLCYDCNSGRHLHFELLTRGGYE